MADLKKFLDQAGVSTLWGQVAAEVAKVQKAADDAAAAAGTNATAIQGHETRLAAAEGKIEALEAGTYDDSEVRGLIKGNTDAIAVLNGDVDTTGSVANTAVQAAAAKVAEVVANADADFDTLKEIADWILNDTIGATQMSNAIAALQTKMNGVEETVVKSIAAAIEDALKVEGAEKYALASELSALADRVKVIEEAGYQNADQVSAAIEAAIAALKLAETYEAKGEAAKAEAAAKAYADGLAVNYEVAGAAAQALTDAKAYTDSEINSKVIALTEAEILAAIAQ